MTCTISAIDNVGKGRKIYSEKSPSPLRWINGKAHKNCQARLIMRYTRNVGSKMFTQTLRGVSAPVAGAIKHTHAIRVRQVEGWGKGKTARGWGTTLFNMQNACNFLVYNLKFQRSQRCSNRYKKKVSIEYTHTQRHKQDTDTFLQYALRHL